jgi:hypothetical protein
LAKTRSGIFFDGGLDRPNHIDGAGVFALTPRAYIEAIADASECVSSGVRNDDKNSISIKLMKMMDRSVAVADVETIRRRDRGADPGLGMAHRGFEILALGKAGGDG